MDEDVKRAVERLQYDQAGIRGGTIGMRSFDDISQPLAALIEAAATSEQCRICGGDDKAYFFGGYRRLREVRHKPDCALMALVAAVNEGGR